jgi:TusA-related sulfurtransferase
MMQPSLIQLDARGLEPPQPMVKILEAIATLPPDATLAAHTDRQPMLLYPMLEQRGFAYETIKQSDGSHLTHIRRR